MNMKRFLMMLAACAVVFVASCSKTEQEQVAVSNGTAVSITSAEIPPVGGRVTFVVSSSVPWRISGKSDWLTLSPTQGPAGTTQVTMSADINRTYTDLYTIVEFEAADGSFRETVDVSQEYPFLELSTDNIDFLWNNSRSFGTANETISVRCNTDWEIQIVSNSNGSNFSITDSGEFKKLDWLLCSQISGTGDATLQFNPDNYNISLAPNNMKMLIIGPLDSYEINISQDNLRFMVDVLDESQPDDNIFFKPCNTSAVNMQIDSELAWSVESFPSWLTLSQQAGPGNQVAESVISIEGANPSIGPRSGDIVLTCEAGTNPLPKRILTVVQVGYELSVPESYVVDGKDYATVELPIVSSGAWMIDQSSIPDWLDVSTFSGVGVEYGEPEALVAFTPTSQNFEFSDRVANIEVLSTEPGNSLSKILKFIQSKFQLEAIASVPSMDTFSLDNYAMSILSDGEWSASISYEGSQEKDWLEISQTTGNLDTEISYRALSANETPYDRKATLILHSVTHDNMNIANVTDFRLPIIQRKYVFEVSPTPQQKSFSFDPIYNEWQYIDIVCSSNWTIKIPEWVIVQLDNGSQYNGGQIEGYGDGRIAITADNYTNTSSSRSGKIEISSVIGKFEYNVSQEAYKFNIPDVDIAMGPEGGTTNPISYTCTGAWEIRNCPSWLAFTPSEAPAVPDNSARSFQITFDLNTNRSSRQAEVLFVDMITGMSKVLKLYQHPFVFNSSAVSHTFDAIATNQAIGIGVECTGAWEVVDCPDWVVLSRKAGDGSGNITLSVKDNTATSGRTATFNVRSKLAGYTKPITITQKAFVFDTKAVTVTLTAADESTHEVTFDYSGKDQMTQSGSPSWVKNPGYKWSDTTYTYVFTSTKNTTKTERTATVTLTSRYNSSLKKTITIKQAAAK